MGRGLAPVSVSVSGDLGAIGPVDVPVASLVSVDGEAVKIKAVVEAAGGASVAGIRGAPGPPVEALEVVGLAVGDGCVATRPVAGGLADEDGEAAGAREQAAPAAEVDDDAVRADDDAP